MTEISFNKSTLIDLINFKLSSIHIEIRKILKKWNEELAHVFLEKARNGTYHEAENDAIDLHQLLKDEKDMLDLLSQIEE